MNKQKYFLAAQLGAAIHLDDTATLKDVAEVLRQRYSDLALLDGLRLCHLFCGIPKLVRSLNALAPFNCDTAIAPPGNGRSQFQQVYGADADLVHEHLQHLDECTSDWIINHAYGSVFANSSFSLLEREMTSVLVLTLSNCHPQALSHVRACLRHGASPSALIDDANDFSWFTKEQRQLLISSINSSIEVND
ncbi:MAG: hypothetical protein H8E25_15390 [Planctomycetes bacterium]|nr:hypothetical protein [Planctomycetota bacterium]